MVDEGIVGAPVRVKALLLGGLGVGIALLMISRAALGSANGVSTPDSGGPFAFPAVALDANGFPVVSYVDNDSLGRNLKILHCNDRACAGNNESITLPDTLGDNLSSSLKLDASGFPVVAYAQQSPDALQLLHCNDANCAGSGDVVSSPIVGRDPSLAIDSGGNPVVSFEGGATDLGLMHCNDADCAGGDESITYPDTMGFVGDYSSLALDAAGNPVASYYDETGGALNVMHCNDPLCQGDDESITSPDSSGFAAFTALVLDADGYPVVTYTLPDGIRVLHCNDADCAGNNESIRSFDISGGSSAYYTSVTLDSAGHPVVSYNLGAGGATRLLRCNDPDCSGGSDTITTVDLGCCVGSAVAVDDLGYISVVNNDAFGLSVYYCKNCSPDSDGDGCWDAKEQQTGLGSEMTGGRRDYLNPNDYFEASHNGEVRINDIVLVVSAYFKDDDDGNPGLPPYAAGYNPDYDRTLLGPNNWNLGPGNGLQRIDDILHEIHQYFHDCS